MFSNTKCMRFPRHNESHTEHLFKEDVVLLVYTHTGQVFRKAISPNRKSFSLEHNMKFQMCDTVMKLSYPRAIHKACNIYGE